MQITDADLQRYKKIICEIARSFDNFCTVHNLRYFGIGGTAIGAIRHKGIIPWDDDIDFVMPRKDYDQFLSLSKTELDSQYEVFSHHNYALYHLSMAKMCKANTSLLPSRQIRIMLGAFIDIFPMDGLPDTDKEGRIEYFNNYQLIRHKAEAVSKFYTIRSIFSSIKHRNWEELRNQFISHWYHIRGKHNDLFDQCDRILKSYPFDDAQYVAYFGTNRSAKIISPKSWFDDYYYAPFEDFEIRLPIGIHQYLSQVFGDYMKLPNPEDRSSGHSFVYLNLEKRYSWEEAKKLHLI